MEKLPRRKRQRGEVCWQGKLDHTYPGDEKTARFRRSHYAGKPFDFADVDNYLGPLVHVAGEQSR